MEHMIGLTDTAYLGRVGEVELGASALAGVYYLVIYMLGFGFSVGAQVLMARRNGEGEYKRIGEVFTQGGLFLFLLAAVLFTASNLLTPHLLHRMIGSEEVYRATMSYLDWRVYGFFFSFIAIKKINHPPKAIPCWIITQIETLSICPSILKSTLVKRNRPYFL